MRVEVRLLRSNGRLGFESSKCGLKELRQRIGSRKKKRIVKRVFWAQERLRLGRRECC